MTQRFRSEVRAVQRLRRGIAIAFGVVVAAATLVASGSAGSDGKRVFKGHGVRALPAFRVAEPSTLTWTNSGSFFQISSAGDYCYDGAVTSNAHQGTTYLSAGRYSDLRVRAIGAWTVTIHAGVEHLGTPITFSGVGEQALRPFSLRKPMTMYWTNTSDRFQTIGMKAMRDGVVSSGRRSGKTRLPAGHYSLVVDASSLDGPMGSWRIVIR
jgi:hypothetical protein